MRFVFALLLLLSIHGSAQIPPDHCKDVRDIAKYERLRHERITGRENVTQASNNFDVKYYRCEWEVDPAVRYIRGIVTVYYVTTSATGFIALDLMNDLVTDSVKQRNLLLSNSQSNNTLTINFGSLIVPGTLDSVSIYYQGIPANTGFGSFIQTTHAGTPVIWSLSEPYGSRDWWPCKNGLDDKADSIDVLITNPVAYKAASNGILQGETIITGGTKILTHWKHRYPIASYLICFSVTNFSVFNNSVALSTGNLPMQTYCYPESLNSFQSGTINTLNAMQLFDTTFGPYPFMNEKYGHVQFGWGGGMEHQTATFVTSIDEGLCAHELAHQWFGDKITCGSWKDIWLNEGFATHLASIYMENKYPAYTISNRIGEISNITNQAGGSVEVDDTANVGRIFDYRLSYLKGSHLLYMLRWILGDSVFFAAMRNYQADPAIRYGFARTEDLKRNLELTSGKNLTYFFNDWFSGQGYPSYRVEWSNLGSGNVWIKINQVTSHLSVSFFQLPIALQFRNATQQATLVINNLSNGETFTKSIGFIADTVYIDPDAWLITRNNTTSKLPSVLPVTLQNFSVNKNRCNAFIQFSTVNENEMAYFNLEYSHDGSNYSHAATIHANGNNQVENEYYYTYPMQPGKYYFFRLKMTGQDGSFTYSQVHTISSCSEDDNMILISPNPVKNTATVSGLPVGKNILTLYGINGQLLRTIETATNPVTIDLSQLKAGLYMLRVEDIHGTRVNKKIIRD